MQRVKAPKMITAELHTGSIAHLNSNVPTAHPASNGVKLKNELAETIVTSTLTQPLDHMISF